MNPFPDILGYLRTFRRYVGRRLYVVFVLTALAGLVEGLGIALLLPLLAALDMGGEAEGAVPQALQGLVGRLGIEGSLVGILALIAGVFLLKGAVQFAALGYKGYLQARLMRELKARLFDAYSRMDYGFYARGDTGHFINVINGQVRLFYMSFTEFMRFATATIMAVAYLGVAMALAWRFGLMAVAVGLLLLVLFKRLNVWVRELSRWTSSETSHLNKLLIQALQAFKYLASTGQMDRHRIGVLASVRRLAGYQARQQVARAFTEAVKEPLSVLFIIGIVIVHVAVLGHAVAPILVAILLFHRGMQAVFSVQSGWQASLNTVGSVEMVRDELDALAEHPERGGSTSIGRLSHEIELRDVRFTYEPRGEEVLRGISLTIPARTTVAFVGESGAGKSTLVDLLTLLLKPTAGEIRIDGVPGPEIALASWRSQIGYVSQETVVFDDTVAANIALSAKDPTEDPEVLEEVRTAARRAHLAHFIESLPDGYDTVVGDRGIRLSGGQRQRLFIARELFKRPSLLILDEATSALDSESERAIQRSIDALHGEMTVVIVAHRLSTIKAVDRVFVLEGGRVVEEGAYSELLGRRESRFKGMVELQAL